MSSLPAFGLRDPVHDSQKAFRIALDTLARPGSTSSLGDALAGVPLGAAQACLLLALTDESTSVWWQDSAAQLQQWLRFHTGARSVPAPTYADFAVITDAKELPGLHRFPWGTADAPEDSCTLLVEVPSLRDGPPVRAHGPGIRDGIDIAVAGLPDGFWAEWQASHAAFPQGVDIFFTCGDEVLGLPRSCRIGMLREV